MPKSKTDFTNFVDARPNYFPGQFLLEDDFEVEQKYLIDRQKYHRQSLHVSGLVEGLEVEVIKDKQEVQIKSGSAINSNGDLIILKKDTSFSKFAPLTNGELYISYKEEKQVKQQEDFTRWQEVPTIGFAATTPNDGVKLAKISIVNNVPNLDLTVRDYSGIFLPNATGNDLTLRSGGNANPNVAILNGSLTVTGTITGNIDATNINSGVLAVERIPNLSANKITSGTLTIPGSSGTLLQVGAELGSTANIDLSGHVQLKEFSTNNLAYLQARNDSSNRNIGLRIRTQKQGTTNPEVVEALTISPTGNVGIGTETPSEKLEVSGNLKVTGSLTAGNKITVPGNQKIEFTDTDITNNLKLQLWTGYGLGINGGTLFYAAAGKHSWRDINGNNERMVLTTEDNGFLTVNGTGTSSFAGNLRVTGTITGKIDATNINSGVLAIDRIPNLSANKITSGTLTIPGSSGTLLQVGAELGSTANIDLSGHVQLKEFSTNNLAYLQARNDSSNRNIGLRIRTQKQGTTNPEVVEALTISPTGNVGIGTETPSEKLEVSGNLKVTGSLTAGNKITVPGNQKIEFTDTDITNNLKLQLWTGYGLGINGGTLFYAAAGKHSWRDINGNNERMVLTTGADGSLTVNGTGTSSFAGNLKVNGSIIISNGVNSVTLSVDNTGLILSTTSSNHGANKKIKWDGDNNWDQI